VAVSRFDVAPSAAVEIERPRPQISRYGEGRGRGLRWVDEGVPRPPTSEYALTHAAARAAVALRLTLVERYGLDEKRACKVQRRYSQCHSQAYPSSRQLGV